MRPPWNPNWDEVEFDHGAILRAADECDRLASVLDDSADGRARAAAVAGEEWRGPHRDRFDATARRLLGRNADLAMALRRLAARLRDQSEDARAEQAHREAARAEWRRQLHALQAEQAARTEVGAR